MANTDWRKNRRGRGWLESKYGMQVTGSVAAGLMGGLSIITFVSVLLLVSLLAQQLLVQFLPRHNCSTWASRDFKALTVYRLPL